MPHTPGHVIQEDPNRPLSVAENLAFTNVQRTSGDDLSALTNRARRALIQSRTPTRAGQTAAPTTPRPSERRGGALSFIGSALGDPLEEAGRRARGLQGGILDFLLGSTPSETPSERLVREDEERRATLGGGVPQPQVQTQGGGGVTGLQEAVTGASGDDSAAVGTGITIEEVPGLGRVVTFADGTQQLIGEGASIEEARRFEAEQNALTRQSQAALGIVPLLQQLLQIQSSPGARLRFSSRSPESRQSGVVEDAFGGGRQDVSNALAQLFGQGSTGVPGLGLGIPTGSSRAGERPSTIPSLSFLEGLSSESVEELDALIEILFPGQRLSDIVQQAEQLAPPGSGGRSIRGNIRSR